MSGYLPVKRKEKKDNWQSRTKPSNYREEGEEKHKLQKANNVKLNDKLHVSTKQQFVLQKTHLHL